MAVYTPRYPPPPLCSRSPFTLRGDDRPRHSHLWRSTWTRTDMDSSYSRPRTHRAQSCKESQISFPIHLRWKVDPYHPAPVPQVDGRPKPYALDPLKVKHPQKVAYSRQRTTLLCNTGGKVNQNDPRSEAASGIGAKNETGPTYGRGE